MCVFLSRHACQPETEKDAYQWIYYGKFNLNMQKASLNFKSNI